MHDATTTVISFFLSSYYTIYNYPFLSPLPPEKNLNNQKRQTNPTPFAMSKIVGPKRTLTHTLSLGYTYST